MFEPPRFLHAFLVASFATLMLTASAHAGPVERVVQIAAGGAEQNRVVLRYENGGDGLLYSDDGGKSARLLCASAIDPGLGRTGRIAIRADGSVLMGVFDGMLESDPSGCTWSRVGHLVDRWINDFAPHPTDTDVMFAITSAGGQPNGIIKQVGSGEWVDIGPREEILINRLFATKNGSGLRFYQSIVRGEFPAPDGGRPNPRYFVRSSDDEGVTWLEHAFPEVDGSLRLEAVDPTDSNRLVATIDNGDVDDVILVSEDAGESFTEYLQVAALGGIAFAADGRFWFGDAGDGRDMRRGVYAAESLSQPARKLPKADFAPFALMHHAKTDTLFASRLLELGSVDLADGTFTSAFRWDEVPGFVECDGVDMGATCERQLCGAWCGPGHFAAAPMCTVYDEPYCGPCADGPASPACIASMGGDAAVTPSTSDAGTVDGGTSSTDEGGCGCSIPGGRTKDHSSSFAALAALLLVAVRRTRKRTRRTRPGGTGA